MPEAVNTKKGDAIRISFFSILIYSEFEFPPAG